MYEEATGDMRTLIEHNMNLFEEVLDKQDRNEISDARVRLKEFLDSVEEDIF